MVKEQVAEETQKGEGAKAGSGHTNITDEVLASIAGMAVKEVPGVASLGGSSIKSALAEAVGGTSKHGRGVGVEAGEKEAILDLQLIVVQGYSIPKVTDEVRTKVSEQLLNVAGLVAKEINISVVGIEFEEKKEQQRVK